MSPVAQAKNKDHKFGAQYVLSLCGGNNLVLHTLKSNMKEQCTVGIYTDTVAVVINYFNCTQFCRGTEVTYSLLLNDRSLLF